MKRFVAANPSNRPPETRTKTHPFSSSAKAEIDFVCVPNLPSFMRRDSRLSGVLHVLVHMAQASEPVTSETLAGLIKTNPVVIRRIMGGLRNKGYVRSDKGHGGGWTIAQDLSTITLLDVYLALGSPDLFALGNRTEAPRCFVEQAVNAALNDTFQEAEALLLNRLGTITLAALSEDFHSRARSADRRCRAESHAAHALPTRTC